MSTRYVCDRCFKPAGDGPLGLSGVQIIDRHTGSPVLDLCAACQASLRAWFAEGEPSFHG